MDQQAQPQAGADQADRRRRCARPVGQAGRQPGDAGGAHQRPGAVRRTAPPCHQAGHHERPGHRQAEDQVGGDVVMDMRARLADGHRNGHHGRQAGHQQLRRAGAHPSASASVLPQSSAFGTKPLGAALLDQRGRSRPRRGSR